MLVAIFSLSACFEPPPKVPPPGPGEKPVSPAPVVQAPEIPPAATFELATRVGHSPVPSPLDADGKAAVAVLRRVVTEHARNPRNPWAVGHGLLALGPEMEVDSGERAVPFLFKTYARSEGERGISFPKKIGDVLIEPHTDLTLKVLTEIGVPLSTAVEVQGQPAVIGDLYRHSLWRAWVTAEAEHSMASFNDSPWALQGLAAAAPADLAWMAEGKHPMSMDLFTNVVAADLFVQTRFMAEAKAKGEGVQKQRQGIFAYTCGGQHLLQGVAYAVARGFGSPTARERVEEQVDILFWRFDVELGIYDDFIVKNPEYTPLLLEQRLKFLGHFVESSHKLAALGIFVPSTEQRAVMDRGRDELIATVIRIEREGHFNDLADYAAEPKTRQMFLDYVGDSAHALRGLALSTGEGSIRY